LAVTDNQPTLHENIRAHFDECTTKQWLKKNKWTFSTIQDEGPGRTEFREIWCCPALGVIDCKKWTGVEQVVCNRSTRIIKGNFAIEDRYFITSSKLAASKIIPSIRGHWGIENKVHWVLDVAFAEDACQLRKDHAPKNRSTIRRWVLTVLRGKPSTYSI
jgi:predicted transposase YbfD/YdcC